MMRPNAAPPSCRTASAPAGRARRATMRSGTDRKRRRSMFDYLIVGAGFAGSVLAERLARGAGKRVLLVDRRPHIGGNAYDHYDDAGILIHSTGRTSSTPTRARSSSYLSRFTEWRPYEHRVLAQRGRPARADPDQPRHHQPALRPEADVRRGRGLPRRPRRAGREWSAPPRTSSSAAVGRELYEKFFRGYTRKQWGLDPSRARRVGHRARARRAPTRDDRYFARHFQAMPLHGYTRMFENMLDHPNIKVMLEHRLPGDPGRDPVRRS